MLAAVVGAVMLLGQAGNPIVQGPAPQNVTVHSEVTVSAPPPDPAAIADASVTSSQAIMINVIAPPPVQWTNDLMNLPDVWRTTPDDLTWNNGQIRGLAELLRNVALGLVALAILANGMAHSLGQDVAWGRLILAVALSVFSLTWWELGTKLNNAITGAIAAPDLPSLIKPHLTLPAPGGVPMVDSVGTVAIVLVYAIVALMLLFSLLFRLGLIDVLIAVGPLALLCFATPQTEHIASHYSRLAVAVLFGQILIVLGLRVASVLGGLGSGGILGTLLSIVVLLLTKDLPKILMAGSDHGSSQGRGMGAAVLLMVRRRFGV